MNETNILQEAVQPRKKLWHGALLGFGCGVFTIAPVFVCLFAIVIAVISLNFVPVTAALEQMSGDAILHSLKVALILITSGSLIAALMVGILSGRQAYRHSADVNADKRLWSSLAAGLGLGLLFLLLGLCLGILFEIVVVGVSFLSDSTFMLYILFPVISGLLASFVGAVLGFFLVFRRMLPKNDSHALA